MMMFAVMNAADNDLAQPGNDDGDDDDDAAWDRGTRIIVFDNDYEGEKMRAVFDETYGGSKFSVALFGEGKEESLNRHTQDTRELV